MNEWMNVKWKTKIEKVGNCIWIIVEFNEMSQMSFKCHMRVENVAKK